MHDHGPDPAEYFERASAHAGGSPEKRLRLAVLLDAIAHLRRGVHPAAEEAARWVRGEIDAMHASFSFRAICETLDLDPGWLASALLRPTHEAGAAPRLPRRHVRTEHVQREPRRYRTRLRPDAG